MLGHKFCSRSVTIWVGLQIRTQQDSYHKHKFLRQFETVNVWILNLKASVLPPMYEGLWTLMQTNHKWFALMISESSWEMPDLEVLVAKKSWFNWVKAKEMGFDLEAACQDRLYLMSPRSCGQAFSRQKWSRIRCCCFVCTGAEGDWQGSAQASSCTQQGSVSEMESEPPRPVM